MRKIFLMALSVFALAMAMVSCEKVMNFEAEAVYKAPQNITIKLDPNPCTPGDTVTATLVYGVAGENWYWYKTTSSFQVPGKFVRLKVDIGQYEDQFKGSCKEPSFCKFKAPETPGSYTVSYHGQITITAGSNIWGDRVDCSAKLTVNEIPGEDEDEE